MKNEIQQHSSIREKLKSSISCFTGTLSHDSLDHQGSSSSPSSSSSFYNKLTTPKTPMSHEYGLNTPRVRGRSLRSRMGLKHQHHRKSQSADFSYDPSSYALNFENESEEYHVRNFSARLPASPSRFCEEIPVPTTVPKNIIGDN